MDKERITIDENLICLVRYSLDIVGGNWKLPILCLLADGKPTRYGVIKRKLGDVTNTMLAGSLKELEAADMIKREQFNEIPPRVDYSLTDKGKSIVPILVQFASWGVENMQGDTKNLIKCEFCQTSKNNCGKCV